MFLTNRSFLLKYHLGWIVLTGRPAPSAYQGSSKGSSTSVSCLHSPDWKEIISIFTLSHRDIHEKPKFIPCCFLNCALSQIKLNGRFPKSGKCCFSGIYVSVWSTDQYILTLSIDGCRFMDMLTAVWRVACNLGTKISSSPRPLFPSTVAMKTLGISAGYDGAQHRQHQKDLEPEAARTWSFAAFMRQEDSQQGVQSCCAEAAKKVLVGFAAGWAGTAWEQHRWHFPVLCCVRHSQCRQLCSAPDKEAANSQIRF